MELPPNVTLSDDVVDGVHAVTAPLSLWRAAGYYLKDQGPDQARRRLLCWPEDFHMMKARLWEAYQTSATGTTPAGDAA